MEALRLDLNGLHEYQQNRYPYLLIDIAEEVVPGKSAKGFKLLHPLDHDFYTACRDKLNWSLSKDEK